MDSKSNSNPTIIIFLHKSKTKIVLTVEDKHSNIQIDFHTHNMVVMLGRYSYLDHPKLWYGKLFIYFVINIKIN